MTIINYLKRYGKASFSILCLLFFCFLQDVYGQRFVPQPERFEDPVYFETQAERTSFLRHATERPRDRNNPFWVITDRSGVRAHDRPSEGSRVLRNLHFKSRYIVTDEEADWVELYTYTQRRDGRRIHSDETRVGWVRKTDLLLWQRSLRDANTRIFKKVFLINRDEFYREHGFDDNRDRVPILAGPGKEVVDTINIFDFYFVYKIEEVDAVRYYLIGQDYQFSTGTFERIIKGWVEADRLTEWDSRIAFEPNFLEAAIQERRNNPDRLALRAFANLRDVETYIRGAGLPNPVWENDPALRPFGTGAEGSLIRRAEGDEVRYRWPGGVLRIPLLGQPRSVHGSRDAISFQSGLAGDIVPRSVLENLRAIDPNTYGSMERFQRNFDTGSRNFNIVFLIEAIDDLMNVQAQFPRMTNAISEALHLTEAQQVRIGVVLYKDSPESNSIVAIEPDADFSRVISNVGNVSFRAVEDLDLDDGTSLYQAMDRGFQMFRESESNIFVIIGKNGDKELARGESANNPGIEALIAKSGTYLPSYLVLSLEDENTEFGLTENFQMFVEQGAIDFHQWWQELLRQAPNQQFPDISEPQFTDYFRDMNGNKKSTLSSFYYAEMVRSSPGGRLRADLKNTYIESFIRESVERRFNTVNSIRELIVDGQDVNFIAAGGFTSDGISALRARFEGMDPEQVAALSFERIKLFIGGWVPYQVEGAEHPLLSTVLFMPEPELIDYINDLSVVIDVMRDLISAQEKALELSDAFCNLYFRVLGEDRRRSDDCSEVSISALRQRVHGIQDSREADRISDFRLGRSWGLSDRTSIADIRNLREGALTNIVNELVRVRAYLNRVRLDDDFSFETTSEDIDGRATKYFWIPLVDAF